MHCVYKDISDCQIAIHTLEMEVEEGGSDGKKENSEYKKGQTQVF